MQRHPDGIRTFFHQLRRRKVFRVGITYLVVGFAIIEGAGLLLPTLRLPSWTYDLVVVLVLLGFPLAIGLAWAFDITPEGVVRTPPGTAAGEAAGDPAGSGDGASDGAGRSEPEPLALPQGPVIAVLPFTNMSGDPGDEFFTDGITEDIITGLTRFTHLFVIARNTTFRYRGRSIDVREVGRELGARYVLEGGIRKTSDQLRVSVQLLETRTGTHLWAETYDRALTAGEIFAVQDEITSRVVATLADPDGVLTRSAAQAAQAKPTNSLDAYEAVLRTFSYWQRQTPAEHAEVRAALERAVEIDPGYSHAWACLAIIYLDEIRVGFNPQPEPARRMMEAAQRAVAAGPMNPLAYLALAQAQFFRGDVDAFFPAGERAVQLNPNDSTTLATVGMLTAFAGDWERGVAMLEKAIALNPHHPGWYHLPLAIDRLREGKYDDALRAALKINMPGYYPNHMVLTAAYGHLGRDDEARASAAELLRVSPDFLENGYQRIAGWQRDPVARDRLVEGLQSAGVALEAPDPDRVPAPAE